MHRLGLTSKPQRNGVLAAVHVEASGLHFFAGIQHRRQGVRFFRGYPLKDVACLRKDLYERTTEDFAQSDREAEANIDVGLRFDALDVLLADPDRVGQSAFSHVQLRAEGFDLIRVLRLLHDTIMCNTRMRVSRIDMKYAKSGVAGKIRNDGWRDDLRSRRGSESRPTSLQLSSSIHSSGESPDEALRKRNGKFPWSNEVVEETIQRALAHGSRKLDVFFMTGLPGQRYDDALAIADYCEHLLDRFGADGRLHPFVAPLGPFLDPGCRAFEQPRFGYTTFCRTLEDHRQAFLHHGWHKILSYETTAMTRDEIVRATYDVAERLNDLEHRHHLIDDRTFTDVQFRLKIARQIIHAADDGDISGPVAELANHGTMFGDDELKWPVKHGFRVGITLLRSLAAGLALEFGHTAARLVGRYDVAPAKSPESTLRDLATVPR
jgi:hypothetical protein